MKNLVSLTEKQLMFDVVDDTGWKATVDVTPIENDEREELRELTRELENQRQNLNEKIDKLTPKADKFDYLLAASSGIITGFIDVFLVGAPNDSKLQKWTDKEIDELVKKFARQDGWTPRSKDSDTVQNAITHLENKYKVPYDLRGSGDDAQGITTTKGHHFDSLAHHPTPVGLFFSIIDQFLGTTTLISSSEKTGIQIVSIANTTGTGDNFKLQGSTLIEKFFCGIVNWFGHIMSDVSGASVSKNGGAGIPGPMLSMIGDVSAILRKIKVPQSEFESNFFDLARNMYTHGFDARFEMVQAIPVIINDLVIRLMYMIRRLVYHLKLKNTRNLRGLWQDIKPFGNVTIKRMLLVGEAVFTALDVADAAIRSAKTAVNPAAFALSFALHVNVVGVGKLVISASGEIISDVKRAHYRNQRIVVTQKLLLAENAEIRYRIADMWKSVPKTVEALEAAETSITKYYLASVEIYRDYDDRVWPELENEIDKLSEEDKREILDFLE